MKKKRLIVLILLLAMAVLQLGAGTTEVPVHVIPIHGDIDPALVVFIRRSIARARGDGASAIIFDIDTFGGRVDSALQIATLIGGLNPIQSIAWVTGGGGNGGQLVGRCAHQPVSRAQMAALAEKNGYPRGLAEAMVDADVELLQAFIDGRIVLLARDEVPAAERRAREEGRTFELGPGVSPPGKLLSLTAGEMLRYGVSSGTVARLDDLAGAIGAGPANLVPVERSLADQAVALITGAAVTTLLILAGLVALYLEIATARNDHVAQQDSWLTSLSKVWPASFRPSTCVK